MSRGGESRRPWTPRDDEELKRLAALEDANHVLIGAALGRSASAVQCRMYGLGIKLRSDRKREDPLDGILFNGEPLQFAESDRACARCGVRETIHRLHGCAKFAADITVRVR